MPSCPDKFAQVCEFHHLSNSSSRMLLTVLLLDAKHLGDPPCRSVGRFPELIHSYDDLAFLLSVKLAHGQDSCARAMIGASSSVRSERTHFGTLVTQLVRNLLPVGAVNDERNPALRPHDDWHDDTAYGNRRLESFAVLHGQRRQFDQWLVSNFSCNFPYNSSRHG